MPYFVIDDHRAGLDRRRLKSTTKAGALIVAEDCLINRGAEIEKRKAFVSKFSLPVGSTKGLFENAETLYVFGQGVEPAGIPAGITYQRLQHPSGSALSEVLSYEEFDGFIYAVARFADASVRHYYNGVEITDWYDGRARTSFNVTGGTAFAGVSSSLQFDLGGGTSGAGNSLDTLTLDGVDILGGAVTYDTNDTISAAAVAAQIASYSSTSGWTATSSGSTVTVSAVATGDHLDGKVAARTFTGNFVVPLIPGGSGGTAGGSHANAVTSITVNGVEILDSQVLWVTSNAATATAIASRIEAFISTPDYGSEAEDNAVVISADDAGVTPNGYAVVITTTGDVTLSSSSLTMGNGAEAADTFEPGEAVRTVQSKMYAVSGTLLHFSGVDQPSKFIESPTVPGAGFSNLAAYSSKGGDLQAMETYFGDLAILAKNNIQIWKVDPDPLQNAWKQTLKNTGTLSPRSVVAYGDNDIFYLGRSGVRSLRARDSSNAAYVSDVGTAIDPYIRALKETLTTQQFADAVGMMDPIDGRYWVAIGSKILVFNFFPDAKVAAWTVLNAPGDVTDFATVNDKIYMRVDDTVYLFGGDDGETYDATEAIAATPYLDTDAPATTKEWTGFDIAAQGEWQVLMQTTLPNEDDPTQDPAYEDLATVVGTTFSEDEHGVMGASTHISMKFISKGTGKAVLGKVAIHYAAAEAD